MEDSVKAFIIGDLHFKRNNIMDGRTFVEKCVPAVEKFKPDFIVILGDTLHAHDTAYNAPFELAYEFIEGLQRIAHVFIIIGNHDFLSCVQFLTPKHFFLPYRRWDNVTVVDHPLCREIGSFTFTFCPYVPNGRFSEALDKLIENGETPWDLSDCIFAHQEFRGCSMENNKVSDVGDKWYENYPPVITGHIHKAQTIKNIYYPGSAYQHTFAEDPDKKVWGVTFVANSDPPGFKIKKMDLKIKGKRRIFLDVSDADQFDESLIDKHQIQLRLRGTVEEFKVFDKSKRAKDLRSKGVKISKDLIIDDVVEERASSHVFLDVFREVLLRKSSNIQEACKTVYPEILKEPQTRNEIIFHESMESNDEDVPDSVEILDVDVDVDVDFESESSRSTLAENSNDSDDEEDDSDEDDECETKTLQTTDSEILNTSDVLNSTEIACTSEIFDSDSDVTDILNSDDFSDEEEDDDEEEEEEEEEEEDDDDEEDEEDDESDDSSSVEESNDYSDDE